MRQGPNFWKSLKYLRVPWKCLFVIGSFKRNWNSFPKSTVWFGKRSSQFYILILLNFIKTSDRLSKFHLIYVYTGARKQHHWMEIWSYLLLGDSILTVFCCCQTNKTYRWGPELGGEIAIFKIQETKDSHLFGGDGPAYAVTSSPSNSSPDIKSSPKYWGN